MKSKTHSVKDSRVGDDSSRHRLKFGYKICVFYYLKTYFF